MPSVVISEEEFEAILADPDKVIEGDLVWSRDEFGSPALEFRVEIRSGAGYPIFVVGRFNPKAGKLSYALIHQEAGRIYALDLGAGHHNPGCERLGDTHKHRWTDEFRDKQAYVPPDITARWDDPVGAWQQFCREANIRHDGRLLAPPPSQRELFL
ncbi:MAG: hypothetical protein KatS3mg115_2681 [Candidatus Poribacteria bacterium]|nr:MAG: hypothetical protein KatS3mg115_2681 [Candidatus Poribacteria bacterium]